MRILAVCVFGVLFDQLFGDPTWLYHPVRIMGKYIAWNEYWLRKTAKNEKAEKIAGAVLWLLVILLSIGVPAVLLYVVNRWDPAIAFALECVWCYQLLAAKSLKSESMKVYDELVKGDLPGARKAVSMIVGRDTEALDETGVAKAAVETVAENTSDGVIAPLLYMLIGGPIFAFFYKAVNTMDSMIGYKNDKYKYFGRFAAKMDDAANYIPARVSAWLMILSAKLLGYDVSNAKKIYLRDRRKHASPNAAQTESVCAGALQIQLAGDAWYFGKLYKKEYIGDPIRAVEPEDIRRAGKLMDMTEFLALLIFGGIRLVIFLIW